jgi:hypothetical protein
MFLNLTIVDGVVRSLLARSAWRLVDGENHFFGRLISRSVVIHQR